MGGNQAVKKYEGTREEQILALVKKKPLYSVDKLHQNLPQFSRHSIQRLLEKKDLSTIEKRLEYADGQVMPPSVSKPQKDPVKLEKKLKVALGKVNLPKLNFAAALAKVKIQPQVSRRLLLVGGSGMVLLLAFWQGYNYVNATPPQIKLERPLEGFVNVGEKLYVSGQVMPVSSRVMVNNQEVALNGDGSFTAIVSIPMGESVLEVKASRFHKTAQVLRLVTRELTEEELLVEAEKEAEERQKAADEAATLDRKVNDLLAAKNASNLQGSFLRIMNNSAEEEMGFSSIVGEVMNLGDKEVSWVMVTAKFMDESGGMVDTKFGFATDFEETLKPGERAEFKTQPTTKDYDYYALELAWEDGSVAGVATQSAEATPAGEQKEEERELVGTNPES